MNFEMIHSSVLKSTRFSFTPHLPASTRFTRSVERRCSVARAYAHLEMIVTIMALAIDHGARRKCGIQLHGTEAGSFTITLFFMIFMRSGSSPAAQIADSGGSGFPIWEGATPIPI